MTTASIADATTKFSSGVASKNTVLLSALSEDEISALFQDFVFKFEKKYADADERKMRMEIFRSNLNRIDEVCRGRRACRRLSRHVGLSSG